jgi:hypothetical protein
VDPDQAGGSYPIAIMTPWNINTAARINPARVLGFQFLETAAI